MLVTEQARAARFGGTAPVGGAEELDPRPLERYLAAAVPGYAPPLQLRKFRGGQSNPTYLLDTGGGRYVLRRRPFGIDDSAAHAVEREYRVLEALQGSGIPVPRPIALCRDPAPIGADFYVMSYVEGRLFWDVEMPGVDPAERSAIYDAMNATLARLHGLDPASIGLSEFGKANGYMARQMARWTRQYRAAAPAPVPAMEELAARLAEQLPRDETALVHGDFRLDNLILHPTEPRIVAVLDWEMSTLGHPILDLVANCIAWRLKPGILAGLAGRDLQALGIPEEAQYVESYLRRVDRRPPENLEWFFAFGAFRLAAILFGVAVRGAQGNATNLSAKYFGDAALEIAAAGLSMARERVWR